jgi:Nucleosome assembly protein (NAP)
VKRRIRALKKLQAELLKLESSFYAEVHELECKYAILYGPLHEKVSSVNCAHILLPEIFTGWSMTGHLLYSLTTVGLTGSCKCRTLSLERINFFGQYASNEDVVH